MKRLSLASIDDTLALGEALGRTAIGGTVVALHGDLGAGKTTFSQGVGAGLGIPASIVSPTFILMAEYDGGRLPLLHADAYRLEVHEVAAIGLDEALERWPGVALVEWASRIDCHLPEQHLVVDLRHADSGREAFVSAVGPNHDAVLDQWMAAYGG